MTHGQTHVKTAFETGTWFRFLPAVVRLIFTKRAKLTKNIKTGPKAKATWLEIVQTHWYTQWISMDEVLYRFDQRVCSGYDSNSHGKTHNF